MNAVLVTVYGKTFLEFRPDLAPNHCNLIKLLIDGGFYTGLAFHRVIKNFMCQTGCPIGDGRLGVSVSVNAEFTNTPFTRGAIGMARANDVNSASSQLFICTGDSLFLNGNYTYLGHAKNMECLDKIKCGPNDTGIVEKPADRILEMRLAL